MTEELKNLISTAKNICIIPSQEPESLTAALALFYTLKELNKNANLIVDTFPEKLMFLVPSLDFISSPKNFIIDIPRSAADVSQIYYEKTPESLKIHLATNGGTIKKDHILFYTEEPKPDTIITLGIKDFKHHLEKNLDSHGFLLDSPIVNIDNHAENLKFGKINIVQERSLSEITLETITSLNTTLSKQSINCILAGLVLYYHNFKSPTTNSKIFELAAQLTNQGADWQNIQQNLQKTTPEELHFMQQIIAMLSPLQTVSVATLDSDDFEKFGEQEAHNAVEKIKMLGWNNDVLVLWRSHASDPMIKGFMVSNRLPTLKNILHNYQGSLHATWAFLAIADTNIQQVKEKILTLLS